MIVGGLAVLANGFTDSGSAAAPSLSAVTDVRRPQFDLEPAPNRATLLNVPDARARDQGRAVHGAERHDVTGAGAAAQTVLTDDGIHGDEERDRRANRGGITKTIVYYRDDQDSAQNQSDANYVADKFFNGASVKPLDPNSRGRAGERDDRRGRR